MAREKDIVRGVLSQGHTDVVRAAVRLLLKRMKEPGALSAEEGALYEEIAKIVGAKAIMDAMDKKED